VTPTSKNANTKKKKKHVYVDIYKRLNVNKKRAR
jgi:hypothetical protein